MSQNDKNELYRWEKLSKPRVYSRSQRVTSEDDVHNWIQKVEEASNHAAAVTFGTKYVPQKANKAVEIARATVYDMHIHDAAYSEAQELLQQWVSEKIRIDNDFLCEDEDEEFSGYSTKRSTSDVKKAWDKLVQPEDDDYYNNNSARTDYSQGDSVEAILKSMMDKELIANDRLNDLNTDIIRNQVDPHVKMQLRHQQVRENRERRLQEKQKKLEEQKSKKEAMFRAMQMVKKEEDSKLARVRHEELAIQQEMAKIRKEMEIEKKQRTEEKLKEKQKQDKHERMQEEDSKRTLLVAKDIPAKSEKNVLIEKKKQSAQKLESLLAQRIADDLRLKQRCFTAWYSQVMKRRLQFGQTKALADWKLLLRFFNAWKSYVRQTRLEKDAKNHENRLKEEQRMQQMADGHYRIRLLKQCFLLWRIFITQEQNQRILDQMQNETKRKMAALLETAAAAAAAAANSTQVNAVSSELLQTVRDNTYASPGLTSANLERNAAALSKQAKQQQQQQQLESKDNKKQYNNISQRMLNNVKKPTEPWQVVKSHLKLTDEELFGTTEDANEELQNNENSESSAAVNSKQPWKKKAFTVDRYEHRHAAQQKMLDLQQKQIQEQQRLIEEMQYLQKQQILHQQLAHQQAVLTSLTNTTSATVNHQHLISQRLNSLEEEGAVAQVTDREAVNSARTATNDFSSSRQTPSSIPSLSLPVTSRSDKPVTTGDKLSSQTNLPIDPKHLNFVQAMEARAASRAQLKAEREERRHKLEEEKLAKMKAEQEARILAEEEEKKRRIEEYKEKKRLEKLREQEKLQQEERYRSLNSKASEHCRIRQIKFRGWRPWLKLIEMRQQAINRADEYYSRTILRKCLLLWNSSVQENLEYKQKKAVNLHKTLLKRRCLHNWKRIKQNASILDEKAYRFWCYSLLSKIFTTWRDYAEEEKVAGWHKERRAGEHNLMRLKKTAFKVWRQYPLKKKAEIEAEKRRNEMRKKVQMLLPDFKSGQTSFLLNQSQ